MKIELRGPVSDKSIAGRQLLGIARAMQKHGAEIHFGSGWTVDPPIPRELSLLYSRRPAESYDLCLSTDRGEHGNAKVSLAIDGRTLYSKDEQIMSFAPGITVADFPWQDRDWYGPLNFLTGKRDAELATMAFDRLHARATDMMARTKPQLAVVDMDSLSSKQLVGVFKDFNLLICADGEPNLHQEFMSTGGVVVAATAGVHHLWLSHEFSYRFNPAGEVAPEVALSQSVQAAIESPEAVYRRAGIAHSTAQFMDWDIVLEKMFLNLESLVPGGDRLRDLYVRCSPPDSSGSGA